MSIQSLSSMAAIALRTLGFIPTVIDQAIPRRLRVLMSSQLKKPRVGSQRQRPNGTSAADPGDEFFDEALVTTLGGTLA
jgi:hypothetical protein